MQVDIQAPVYCRDGTHVGKVDRVVIEPDAKLVTHIVTTRAPGCLATSSSHWTPSSAPKRRASTYASARLKSKRCRTSWRWNGPYPAEGWVPPPGYFENVVLWPPYFSESAAPTRERQNIGANEVAVTEGTDVECTDGKLGVVDQVVLDASTGRLEGFVVRRGILLRHDVIIPAGWIAQTDADVVRLNVTKDQVAREAQRAS